MSRVTLAVLNIGWTCTRQDLRSHFMKFGKVQSVKIPMYESGFNKRVAFVKMSSGFSEGIFKDYHVIDGYEVSVELQNNKREKKMSNLSINNETAE